MGKPMRNIILRFDMRSSPQCSESQACRYQAVLDMATWADKNEVDVIGLSEHHNSSDGFLSSPLTLAAMIAAKTQRIRISVSALLIPLHDPIRIAEEIAVIDQIAKGRFMATAGLGYRESEYQLFGVEWGQRGKIFDQKLAVLLRALKGEAFEYKGSRVQLNPSPTTPAQLLIMIGGNSKAAARRAARFGLMFSPAVDDPAIGEAYNTYCAEMDFAAGHIIYPRAPASTIISNNPERSWKELGEFLLYDAKAYGAWRHKSRRAYAESFATDLEELKQEGKYRILTPEQAIECIEETGSLHLTPLIGGVSSKAGWESLRLFENEVQPYITRT